MHRPIRDVPPLVGTIAPPPRDVPTVGGINTG